jgi:hypothetical protein
MLLLLGLVVVEEMLRNDAEKNHAQRKLGRADE